jgi:predicted DNA-binding protein with PD1-like motif
LLSGTAQKLQIMTGGPDPEEGRIATYHGPHFVECPARVLGGHGAIGSGTDGSAMHAHAVFIDLRGNARGCHVVRNRCIAAAEGIVVALFPIQGACFCVKADAETRFDIFFPEAAPIRELVTPAELR